MPHGQRVHFQRDGGVRVLGPGQERHQRREGDQQVQCLHLQQGRALNEGS